MATELIEVTSEEQVEVVVTLARAIWREHYVPIIGGEQVDYMLRTFQGPSAIAEQRAAGSVYVLLLQDDAPAGYAAVAPAEAGLLLSKLYVKRTYRGRGLGKRLLAFAEAACRDHGFHCLWLTVNKHNAASIAWYERRGFTNVGSLVTDIGGGFVMDDYRMEKPL
jgi:ribosomal protein S18 acetylase RimI-like enzyme